MVLTAYTLIPSGTLAEDLFRDSLGETQLLVKNGFYQEYFEMRVPQRSQSHDSLPRFVDRDGSSDVSPQQSLSGSEESLHRALEAVTVSPHGGCNGKVDPIERYIQTEAAPIKPTAYARGSPRKVPDSQRTTLMIRNLPMKATQQTLLQTWVADGSYDFLYMPVSFENHRNLGYAFINFSSHDRAISFYKEWQGRTLEWPNARKKLKLSWAFVQGRDNNLLQFANYKIARIKNILYQPAIFKGTRRVPLRDALSSARAVSDDRSCSTRCCSDEE